MDKQHVEELVQRALDEYEIVMAEYNRPSEDVVMYSTCHIIERAIVNFLDAFIISNNEIPLYGKDILSLQKRCIDFDESFNELDYTFIPTLRDHTDDLQGTLLYAYINALKQTKELVTSKLSLTSSN